MLYGRVIVMQDLPALLLPWFQENKRELPWRRDQELYHVWLSEIMLQQTRVEAVKGYYERFLQQLPTIEALAQAEENLLLKLWEGLGYYSRVRNLQKAARQIVSMESRPNSYEALLSLPGIGPYTAGAIASICFEQPTPAVDGNVLRVLSRILARTVSRQEATALLEPIYPVGHCGDFTQALMELGATVCVPNGFPLCEQCPLRNRCQAKQDGTQLAYPQREKKKDKRVEERTVFVLVCEGCYAVCKRPSRGLLAGLWQLPDVVGTLDGQQAIEQAEQWGAEPRSIEKIRKRQHIFTHVRWELTGVYLQCACKAEGFLWVTEQELRESIGLPTAYRQFLEQI